VTGTRRRLLRLWIGMLVATAVALIGAVVAIDLSRRDANALRAGEAPAREGLAAARESLVGADTEVISRFAERQTADATEERQTAGPGEDFWTAMAAAGQQLTQVSQADIGGTAAEEFQVVNGLLITYIGLVEQAFRGDPDSLLSGAYLQYAHRFLNNEVLGQLSILQRRVDEAAPRRPPWGRHLLWSLPLLVLAGLLVRTQVWCSRHFRRTLSAPLLAASTLVVAFGVTAVLALDADRDVSKGRTDLTTMVDLYQARETTAGSQACSPLRGVSEKWPPPPEACETAVPIRPDLNPLTMANKVSTTAQSAAAASARSIVLLLIAGLLIGSLITLGLLPRIEEYRVGRR
jgi:hypothetical protein